MFLVAGIPVTAYRDILASTARPTSMSVLATHVPMVECAWIWWMGSDVSVRVDITMHAALVTWMNVPAILALMEEHVKMASTSSYAAAFQVLEVCTLIIVNE